MKMSLSKRAVSAIIALSMILTMMSGLSFSTVSAATAVSVDTWAELKTALESTGDVNVTVTADIEFTATSADTAINNCISVSSGDKIVDLNGKGVTFTTEAFEYMEVSGVPKSPINVSGTAVLKIKDSGTYGVIDFVANKSEHYAFTAPKQSGGLISVSGSATVKVENAMLNNAAIGPCINVVSGSPKIVLDAAMLTTGSSLYDWSGGFALFISDATTKPTITMSNGSKLSCSNTNAILSEYSNGAGSLYVGNYNTSFDIKSATLAGTVQARVANESVTKLPFVSVSTHQIKVNKTIHTTDSAYLLGPKNFDISADSTDAGAGHYHLVIVEKLIVDGTETINSQNISTEITQLSDVVEESDTFDSVVKAFEGAYGATEEGYTYDFTTDIANSDLYAGATYFKDKFSPDLGSSSSSFTVTPGYAAKMDGFVQFCSDVRWTSASELAFDLKMGSAGNDFAGFYVKYGKEVITNNPKIVFFSNDGVRKDGANSTTGTTGIGFSFRTIDSKPCIEIFVKYLDDNGNLCVKGNYYYDVVENLAAFNRYRVSDDNAGTIKFYANDVLFATVVCKTPKVPTVSSEYKEQYYSEVTLMDQTGAVVATVENALVSTSSAIAFATRSQTLELDNFVAKDKLNTDPKLNVGSLVLENDITMRMSAYKANIDAVGYTNLKLHAYYSGKVQILEPKEGTANGSAAYNFDFQKISPYMMNDEICFILYAELDGEVYASAPTKYSVAKYATSMLSKSTTSAALKTLIVDMIQYGAASQVYQKYNTDKLVNSILTPEQVKLGTQTKREYVDSQSVPNGGDGAVDDLLTWKRIDLILRNKVVIRPAFMASSSTGLHVKVTDIEGNLIQIINTDKLMTTTFSTGSGFMFEFENLKASEMSKEFCFTVYNEYDQAVSGTLVYSIESYAYRKHNDTKVEGLADVVNTMMMYGDSIVRYFGLAN